MCIAKRNYNWTLNRGILRMRSSTLYSSLRASLTYNYQTPTQSTPSLHQYKPYRGTHLSINHHTSKNCQSLLLWNPPFPVACIQLILLPCTHMPCTHNKLHRSPSVCVALVYSYMLNKNTWGVKKCGANQKQHCKQAGATKRFDIS